MMSRTNQVRKTYADILYASTAVFLVEFRNVLPVESAAQGQAKDQSRGNEFVQATAGFMRKNKPQP